MRAEGTCGKGYTRHREANPHQPPPGLVAAQSPAMRARKRLDRPEEDFALSANVYLQPRFHPSFLQCCFWGGTCQKDATACQWEGTSALHGHKELVQGPCRYRSVGNLSLTKRILRIFGEGSIWFGLCLGLEVSFSTSNLTGHRSLLHYSVQRPSTIYALSLAGLRKLSGRTSLVEYCSNIYRSNLDTTTPGLALRLTAI